MTQLSFFQEVSVKVYGLGPVVEEVAVVERKWNIYDACAAVEGFDGEEHTEEELLEAWQFLVNDGIVWQLQGWYGRTAMALIEQGLIESKS